MAGIWDTLWRHDPTDNNFFQDYLDNRWHKYVRDASADRSSERGGVIKDDKSVSIEFGRKPYMGNKAGGVASQQGTYFEMMQRTPDKAIFNELLQEQSEFKKPYLDDPYEEMENFYPLWNFKFYNPMWDWEWRDAPGEWPMNEVDNFEGLYCWELRGHQILWTCGKDYIQRRPLLEKNITNVILSGPSYDAGDITLVRWNNESFTITATPDSTGHRFAKFTALVKYDGKGASGIRGSRKGCEYEFINACKACDCPNEDPPVFDEDSIPDSIGPGLQISLIITDGCGPFTWTITDGTGYTLSSSVTTIREVGLTCAAGTCGNDFSPTVTVQVRDACGKTDSLVIGSGSGTWAASGSECLIIPTSDFCDNVPACDVGFIYVYYTSLIRWKLTYPSAHCYYGNYPTPYWSTAAGGGDACTFTDQITCGNPFECLNVQSECIDEDPCDCYYTRAIQETFTCD